MAWTHGQVTCVLGDNGAGKSTLIKILSGVHKNDSGTMQVDGVPTVFGSPSDARRPASRPSSKTWPLSR